MRRILPILLTLALLLAAFAGYLTLQKGVSHGNLSSSGDPSQTSLLPATRQELTFVGPGRGAWLSNYDESGRTVYRFRVDYFDNEPGGIMNVTAPVIELFPGNGQIIHIEGKDGIVRYTPGADRNSLTGGGTPSEPPRSGLLHDVTVKFYASAAKQAAGQQDMTLTMTNAEFDNDTFRLFTQEYTDPQGRTVKGDRVPVSIRSENYHFDGNGMVMYWNDRDKQLKSLDVAHCRELTIYNAQGMSGAIGTSPETSPVPPAQKPATPSPALNNSSIDASPNVSPDTGVNTPPPAANPSTNSSTKPSEPASQKQRYTATLNYNVRVIQNGQQLMHGDRLDIDFSPRGQGDNSAAQNSTNPSTIASTPAKTGPQTNSTASSAPSSNAPLQVYWDGPMHMVPTDLASAPPLPEGQSVLTVYGSPVQLHQSGEGRAALDATCAAVSYHTADESTMLIGSDAYPLVILQKKPDGSTSVVSAQALQYSRAEQIALLQGAGYIHFPDPADPKSALKAQWSKACVVRLVPVGGQLEIQSADLSGDVVVDHPKFHLNSDDLALSFEPGEKTDSASGHQQTAQLHQIVATGQAVCIVHEAKQQDRRIAAQRLQLLTSRDSANKLYASNVLADGSVDAQQADQRLQAEHLAVELSPAPPGKKQQDAPSDASGDELSQSGAQLEKLVATENVRVTGKNNTTASGDELTVQTIDGQQQVILTGSPAVVVDKDSTLRGPLILLTPHAQTAQVQGAGTLTASEPAANGKPAQPVHVVWTQGISLDGPNNLVTVSGDVRAQSTAADGTVQLASSKQMLITLAQKPATQPSDTDQKPDANDPNEQFNFMHDKQVSAVALVGDGKVESAQTSAAGHILRRFDIIAERINFDAINHRLTVPMAGSMLAEDHQPPAPQPAADNGSTAAPAATSSNRGTTAFHWDKQFVYDEIARTALLDGDVLIVHRDDGPTGHAVRINADTVNADFTAAASTPGAAPPAPGDVPRLELQRLTAGRAVRVSSGDEKIDCGELIYDPIGQHLICRAGDLGIVTVYDAQHRGGATFGEVWINTQTYLLEKMIDLTAHGRQGQ